MSPCCDDTMPMNTNIQTEYFEFMKLLNLSKEDMKEMAISAVDSIFDETNKQNLVEIITKF